MLNRNTMRLLAFIWALLCVICICFVAYSLQQKPAQSDLLALLPQTEHSQNEGVLRSQLSKPFERSITVALSSGSPEVTEDIERVFETWLSRHETLFNTTTTQNFSAIDSLKTRALYSMTIKDEKALIAQSQDSLFHNALSTLTAPFVSGAFNFLDDPFLTSSHWLQERLGEMNLTPHGNLFSLQKDDQLWLFAFLHIKQDGILSQSEQIQTALTELRSEFSEIVSSENIFLTGLPLFTIQAAQTAETELTVLGTISLLGIVLLGWYWFGNLRTLVCILLITLQSFAFATCACLLLFGEIHLIALVFGTTLIGITVDYSAHYFCKRLGQAQISAWRSLKSLLPDLSLALLSTLTAFAAMALAPLPGLQQMAVFSMSGIVAAFVAVCLWLPLLEAKQMPFHVRMQRFAKRLNAWPTLVNWNARALFVLGISFGLFCLVGISQLKLDASIYELNNANPTLLQHTQKIGSLLNTASTSQYFVVHADDAESRLEREEALEEKLLMASIPGVSLQSHSDWIPSEARQLRIDTLKVELCQKLNPMLLASVGVNLPCERYTFANNSRPLEPIPEELVPPSIENNGSTALVLVRGVNASNVIEVADLAWGLEGVAWRNYPEEISAFLNHYRNLMAQLLGLGIVCVALILFLRFKRRCINALLPTICGIAFTLAVLGYSGHTVSLFTAAACVLLLGLGIDYGIFLTAGGSSSRSLCAISFAALTTLLSFGLLAFSQTPALQSFGLTVAIGETFIWLCTPLLRSPREHFAMFAELVASNAKVFKG